jgi:hypothetical protein
MTVSQLTNAQQFELAKLRISKILSLNGLTQYISALTTYPAVAAINSTIGELAAPYSGYQLVKNGGTVISSSQLYSTTDSLTAPVYPINKLIALYTNDLAFFNIVTSKAYMLAYTNANAPVAWDDPTHNIVYNSRATGNGILPNTTWNTSYGTTSDTESLQYFTNYAAAMEMLGEIPTVGFTAAANAYAINTASGGKLTQGSSYLPFQCIVGEQDATASCTLAQWAAKTRQSMLTLNMLTKNTLDITNATGPRSLNSTDATNTGANGVIPNMTTSIDGSDLWTSFDRTYLGIYNNAGGRDTFLSLYNKFNYDIKVTPVQYYVTHEMIKNIDGFRYLSNVIGDSSVTSLISKGYIWFTEANNDYSPTGQHLLSQPAFKSWSTMMPIMTTSVSTMALSPWFNYNLNGALGSGGTEITLAQYVANSYTPFPSEVFYSFATDTTLANLLSTGSIDFWQLNAVDYSSGVNGTDSQAAYHYLGINGNLASSSDNYTNFKSKFVGNPFAISMLKAGLPLNAFCADLSTNFSCKTEIGGLNLSTATISGPPYGIADEFTNGKGSNAVYNCVFNQEMVTLINSSASYLWDSDYHLLASIAQDLCGGA